MKNPGELAHSWLLNIAQFYPHVGFHQNTYSIYLSSIVHNSSISLYDMSFALLTLYHTVSQNYEMSRWCFSEKNTHLTPPSFHCDQIAKRCVTE